MRDEARSKATNGRLLVIVLSSIQSSLRSSSPSLLAPSHLLVDVLLVYVSLEGSYNFHRSLLKPLHEGDRIRVICELSLLNDLGDILEINHLGKKGGGV